MGEEKGTFSVLPTKAGTGNLVDGGAQGERIGAWGGTFEFYRLWLGHHELVPVIVDKTESSFYRVWLG